MPTRCLLLALLCITGILGAEPKRDRYGDPLPEGAIARLGTIRLRNQAPIQAATFSPDGKTLATIGHGGIRINYWDLATGQQSRTREIPVHGVIGMKRFSADGKTLLVATESVIYFFDTARGEELWTLTYSVSGGIWALELARDGKTLVANHQGIIVVWDVANGKPLHEFKELYNVSLPSGLPALTADGKQLVLPRADGSLHLVDTASGKEIRTLEVQWGKPARNPNYRLA
jgi:WD40 repeat protein